MNRASLDAPPAYFADPGPDQRTPSLDEHVDAILATVGADRIIDPQEMRSIQRLMGGLQAIAAQRAAMESAAQPEMADTPEAFGAGEGVEEVPGYGGMEGTMPFQG